MVRRIVSPVTVTVRATGREELLPARSKPFQGHTVIQLLRLIVEQNYTTGFKSSFVIVSTTLQFSSST